MLSIKIIIIIKIYASFITSMFNICNLVLYYSTLTTLCYRMSFTMYMNILQPMRSVRKIYKCHLNFFPRKPCTYVHVNAGILLKLHRPIRLNTEPQQNKMSCLQFQALSYSQCILLFRENLLHYNTQMIGKRAIKMLLKLGQPMSLSYELLRVQSVYGFSFAHPLSIGG